MNGDRSLDDPVDPVEAEDLPESEAPGGSADPVDSADGQADLLADRWTAYEVPDRSPRRVLVARVAIPLFVVVLVGAGYFIWSQWPDWTGCRPSDDRVVDEAAELCYDHPSEMVRLTDAEIEQQYPGPGLAYDTSGLRSASEDGPLLEVSVDEYYYADGANADVGLEKLAENYVVGSELMRAVTEPETRAEATVIDGHEAATATAFGTVPSSYQEGDGDLQFWARVTVVDIGESVSVMYSSATVGKNELDDEDGAVALLEGIHDSITVK